MSKKRKTSITRLREEREQRGWTLDFLHACLCALIDDAQKAPISLRQIESWERGEHLPHPYWRQKLCTVYQKSAVELGLVRTDSLQKREFSSRDEYSARQKYLQRLYELYGTIKLPIGPTQGFSLQAVFQPLRLCQAVPEGDERNDNEDSLIVENGDEALKKSPSRRIVILGGAGTGKSTLLKYFVGNRALEAMKNEQAPLPIFIALPELGRSGKTFKDHLLATLQNMVIDDAFVEVIWEKLQQGQAFICLDSLDEVVTGQADIMQKLNTFMASVHPQTTCVISSRFTDFKRGQFISNQAMEWELLPLDYQLCQMLAQRLLPELQRQMLQVETNDPKAFLRTLEMHPRIAAWGKNPLLFSLAAILYVRQGKLPESRKELYLQVVDAIIELRESMLEWRITLREIFGALAYKLLTERKGRTFSITDLILLLRQIRQEQSENWLVEDIARKVRNVGLLEVMGQGSFSFLHQTFQEYLAGYHVAFLPVPYAEQEIDRLVEHIDDPFCRQIIIELAYVANWQKPRLEKYLYQSIIKQYARAKMDLLDDQQTSRLTSGSAISEGCNAILQALVDLWDRELCETLQAGSPERKEDGELASSIAWVFEHNPRSMAVPALVAGLSLYKKKGRFIGALGEIATEEAKDALYTFTVAQLTHPTDIFLFRYLATSLGQARVERAIPLLQMIRDRRDFDLETRFEAHHALRSMDQESSFDEQDYYQLERVLQSLSIEDEQHRPSDWRRVTKMARWLQENYIDTQSLQRSYSTILQALEGTLDHAVGSARQVGADVLGDLGNNATFVLLLQRLEDHTEPAYDVANSMLASLERLAKRQQMDVTQERLTEAFLKIHKNYPALEEELARTQMKMQMIMENIS